MENQTLHFSISPFWHHSYSPGPKSPIQDRKSEPKEQRTQRRLRITLGKRVRCGWFPGCVW